jgi:hypothetical protein
MNSDEFLKVVRAQNSAKPGTHSLETGLSSEEWNAWQVAHPGISMPTDLISFLHQCNGFRLFPKPETSNGIVRLLPLRVIEYAPNCCMEGRPVVTTTIPNRFSP